MTIRVGASLLSPANHIAYLRGLSKLAPTRIKIFPTQLTSLRKVSHKELSLPHGA